MNSYQEAWYEQVKSDYETLQLLIENGAAPCHVLHYLQMVTEKLGKAYYWRNGKPPPKSHRSFVRFLQLLDGRPKADRERIAKLLGFPNGKSFQTWISRITALAHDLEQLAPALAGDHGPNTEYPWPRDTPTHTPATYRFPKYQQLTEPGSQRQFLVVVKAAVDHFPEYA